MDSDPDCIFCKIASGVAPSFKVYEDDHALAFMDINPYNERHALAIPKAHYINLLDVSADADGGDDKRGPACRPGY